MSVKKIVKVMNFHSLLRVNTARKKVEQAHSYEQELKKVISSIVNNRIFTQEHVSLDLAKTGKELNIYIGSDFGFCSSFNIDVLKYIQQDNTDNDKIIIGKKINIDIPNKVLYLDKEKFFEESDRIYEVVLNGVLKKVYSKINIIYIHYYNLNRQEILKRTILPFDFDDKLNDENIKLKKEDDFSVEGDLMYIIWNLISIYVSTEIKIAEAWSWASENVKRQAFTSESLKKIDEREIEQNRVERKARKKKEFEIIIESNNKKIANLKKEV